MAEDRLRGWSEIAKYLRIDTRTAQRYETSRGLPVYRLPGGGEKSPVFAIRSEVEGWVDKNVPPEKRRLMPSRAVTVREQGLEGPILDRIRKISSLKLYRRNYLLRFVLRPTASGVRANLECRYELCNVTEERQPFAQEVTVDDPDHGYVEEMSLFAGGRPTYVLAKPPMNEKAIGYSIYRGPEILIEPKSVGVKYECRAAWVINRSDSDFWCTHMALPTIGVTLETLAPKEFAITRSFSVPDLVMTAEHVDVAWARRR